MNHLNDDEPKIFDEAMSCPNAKHWINVINDEMKSLTINNTWTLVMLPRNCKIISCKWIYKLKERVLNLQPPRYKASHVAKGFTQREEIDYNKIFSSIVKQTSIRMSFSLVVQEDLKLEQLDVKTTSLHGDLTEDIYMNQPQGCIEKGKEDHVCYLKKSIYGFKQSPRCWYSCAFINSNSYSSKVYLLLYVDHMLLAGKSKIDIKKVKIARKNLI